ncbi:MAG: hypothetical protein RLZZ612_455, partial [Pseudomonadota bacterium]
MQDSTAHHAGMQHLLQLPFFEDRHRQLVTALEVWAHAHVPPHHSADVDAECRALVHTLG